MKTRIIYTKIWKDDWFLDLSDDAQRLFFFLLTCEDIGLSGIFEISDREITTRTRLAGERLENAKQELSKKVLFHNGWCSIVNNSKYYSYKGEKNEKACVSELSRIPADTLSILYPYSIDTPINHKSKIINQNSETDELSKPMETVPSNYGYQAYLKRREEVLGK